MQEERKWEIKTLNIPMVPFSLDEWSNPESHIQSLLPDQLDELHQITISMKVVLPKIQNIIEELD